jgi:phosphate transport system substrate-binding protein
VTATPLLAEEFDLSGLPAYKPEQPVAGIIRIWGAKDAKELVPRWQYEFSRRHHIRYRDYLLGTMTAFSGLVAGTAEVGVMGHRWWRTDLKAFEEFFGYGPLEIKYATGSFSPEGQTAGVVLFVNKSNPLTGLTLDQVDGIFCAQRTGAWTTDSARGRLTLKWSTRAARGPESNIRTWGQLGLTGEWADKPIHIVGHDRTLSNWSDLLMKTACAGSNKWKSGTEVPLGGVLNRAARGMRSAEEEIVKAVTDDPYAIAFDKADVMVRASEVKVLPLAATKAGPFIPPTAASFQGGTYPLNNAVYIYVNRPPGAPLPPRIKEFLRYILSRDGQRQVAEEGTYLPLDATSAREELEKLE